ncbi:ADP-heptose:LPS heptosyltransferase [Methylobacterium phyllostachyos]|uniref:ADP-heptose:LPS heptosyltransferase n=1 Tax=Methylobacterium phyllostachyos TaxID=582672 RepID=A0A1G9RAJ7_9HYPH|nr:glycosyltransferase family 9 protein [Methylobacterium phyllostachyos]SDM19877.1 ADP-heptose:LPS heptosyltransferase [Methylobacterium phyllostachyos]
MTRSSGNSHLIDRWAGRIFAQRFRYAVKKDQLPLSPRRVGIIQPTAIGDTLISSAAIRQIVEFYQDAEITILHGSNNLAALKLLNFPVTLVACNFRNPLKARRQIIAQAFDLIVDLTPWPYVTAICARAAPFAIGFAPPDSSRHYLFDIAIRHDANDHELANLERLRSLFPRCDKQPVHPVSPNAVRPDLSRSNTVYLHPFAGGRRAHEKSWPVGHWVELASMLASEGFDLCITGGKADVNAVSEIIDAMTNAGVMVTSLCGKTSLAELASLLTSAKLLVSVDTGVVHLGSACNARVLSLHGPTSSKRWGAWGSQGHSVDSPHPDAGYIIYGFEDLGRPDVTMQAITASEVFQTAMTIVSNDGKDPIALANDSTEKGK